VFRHRDFPEAGLQVPAGTAQDGETPRDAVVRELFEESGLADVRILSLLGRYTYDMAAWREEIQERFVFHLEPTKPMPSRWLHYERHGGPSSDPGIAFCLYWVELDDPELELAAGQGALLSKLRAAMGA